MSMIEEYIRYIESVRRYSPRTVSIYSDALHDFARFAGEGREADDAVLLSSLRPTILRAYEIHLLEGRKLIARTVNLHLSVLSSFCRFLIKQEVMKSNPVALISRPKEKKRLPEFYTREAMDEYFRNTEPYTAEDSIYLSSDAKTTQKMYEKRLRRLIVSILYSTGIRRSELIAIRLSDIDFRRNMAKVRGKGDKIREIPLIASLCKEISLYLQAVETMVGVEPKPDSALLLTFGGRKLYPMYVDRAIKSELGEVGSITGRKSPHVLRHSLATELLNEGADLNSIKELLGHSSLGTTQVYTHNSIAKLKRVYETAHPRASKNGGKNGD